MESKQQRILNINVGILGHVDSGKTSLVKALSTSLSTAALDKNPQSQQRGITLDLGFSSFTLPLPRHLEDLAGHYDTVQFTLVDCPGHASLIRTIIGGAQIIDLVLLVIDVNKGIQTQTAECIVISEITTDQIIVVLNKIDAIVETEKNTKIAKMNKRIRKTLFGTKFADAAIVPVSAVVGGERIAAISGSGPGSVAVSGKSPLQSLGIDALVDILQTTVRVPQRQVDLPFYYAIDHCFPIKGHGTVLTGTVLSGSISLNQLIEIPHIQTVRKVKSMQMFRKPVEYAQQGDRVGICVTNLDAKLIERSVAAAPGTVPLLSTAVCLVKKVRFFKLACRSQSKSHITVGHSTVVANVVFFGADELKQADRGYVPERDYLHQDAIEDEGSQWAMVQFQQPIYAPLGSLVIGSRLDTEDSHNMCRLAFHGPIVSSNPCTGVFVWKDKYCSVLQLSDVRQGLTYEAIAWKLAASSASIQHYLGMKVVTANKIVGRIISAYGSEGQFRVKFPAGARLQVGDTLLFRYKKYLFDKTKAMVQADVDEECVPDVSDPEAGEVADADADVRMARKAAPAVVEMEAKPTVEAPLLPPTPPTAPAVPVLAVRAENPLPVVAAEAIEQSAHAISQIAPPANTTMREGQIESLKPDPDTPSAMIAIVSGAFRMEENVKAFTGAVARAGQEEGLLVGAFGKMGKCKVRFVDCGNRVAVGGMVRIFIEGEL